MELNGFKLLNPDILWMYKRRKLKLRIHMAYTHILLLCKCTCDIDCNSTIDRPWRMKCILLKRQFSWFCGDIRERNGEIKQKILRCFDYYLVCSWYLMNCCTDWIWTPCISIGNNILNSLPYLIMTTYFSCSLSREYVGEISF